MKTPEKVYLQICGDCNDNNCENCKFEDLEDNVTWCKDKIFNKDIEYIRKDALMEWAKELKLLLKDKSGTQYKGAEVVVNGIIDKIESL